MSVTQFLNNIGDSLEAGDVLVIADEQSSKPSGSSILVPEVDLTTRSYDTRVCGIVSHVSVTLTPPVSGQERLDSKGKQPAKAGKDADKKRDTRHVQCTAEELADLNQRRIDHGKIGLMVTLGVFADCKVDADIAPIKVGDLLTTSHTKGHAQKVIDPSKAVGAIVGKALGNLKKGKGNIPVLVMLQ